VAYEVLPVQGAVGLPPGFVFSQGSLQDFVDCPRRFELRYLYELAWPAIQSEPALENERFMQRGAFFHRLVHQRLLGLEAGALSALVHEDDLGRWWENFLAWEATVLGEQPEAACYPELSLWAPLGAYRLTAKLDLLVVDPAGRFTIYDWKTGLKRTPRRWLAERLQTRVYPCLLAQAGAHLNGGNPVPPDKIEMIYWFAEFPDRPERFAFSEVSFGKDEAYLAGLVEQITRMAEKNPILPTSGGVKPSLGAFHLTSDLQRCAYCVYRSLCERGERAGSVDEAGLAAGDWDDSVGAHGMRPDVSIDFEHIAEIEF
jgi:hypothetical protein